MSHGLAKEVVSNLEIEQLIAIRESRDSLKRRLELMDQSASDLESALITKLERGADLLQCGYSVSVQQTSRRFPRWRELYVEECGVAATEAALEATPATIYRKLVIK